MLKFFSFFAFFLFLMPIYGALNETTKPSLLNIYIDQNAPYSGFSSSQQAQGLIVDYWQLWSKQTKIPIKYHLYQNESLPELLNVNSPSVYAGLLANRKSLLNLKKEPLFVFKSEFYYLPSYKNDFYFSLNNKSRSLVIGGLLPQALKIISLADNTSITYKEYPGLLELILATYNGEIEALVIFNDGQGVAKILNDLMSFIFDKKAIDITANKLFAYTSAEQTTVLEWLHWGNQLDNMPDKIAMLLENASNPIWATSEHIATKLLLIFIFIVLILMLNRSKGSKDREFKNILDSSPYPLAILSLNGSRIFYLNDEVRALVAFNKRKGRYVFQETENKQVISTFISQASHQIKIDDQRLRILVDGRFHDIEISAKRIHYKRKTAWFCHFKDVTALLRAERKLTEERELLRKVLDSIPEQIAFKSPKGTIIGCNKAWATANNTTVLHATGSRIADMLSTNLIHKQKQQESMVWSGDAFNTQEWIKQGNERLNLINFVKLPLYNDQGTIFAVLSIDSDITDFYNLNEQLKGENLQRKKTEKALSKQNLLLRIVFAASLDAMGVLDHEGRIFAANDAFAKLMNSNADDIIGQLQSDLLPPDRADLAEQQNQQVLESGEPLIFEEVISIDGEEIRYQIQKSAFTDPESESSGIVILGRQLIQDKQIEEAQVSDLEECMVNDPLLGVPERRAFELQYNNLWQEAASEQELLSLILCDIDLFKSYNENYGQQMGDQALQEVGQILQAICEPLGCFVARYGGDEFVMLIKGGNATSALKIAESIRTAIADAKIEHLYSSVNRILTVSMGLSNLFPSDLNSSKMLLAEADGALYIAKETGRDQICVH